MVLMVFSLASLRWSELEGILEILVSTTHFTKRADEVQRVSVICLRSYKECCGFSLGLRPWSNHLSMKVHSFGPWTVLFQASHMSPCSPTLEPFRMRGWNTKNTPQPPGMGPSSSRWNQNNLATTPPAESHLYSQILSDMLMVPVFWTTVPYDESQHSLGPL